MLIFLLRLPFLFEPHWYSDETIYLTLAQAIKRGAILYRDIYDLKPPLIYFTYFLAQSHLFWARLLATFSVLLTSLFIFRFSKSLLATAIFGLLTSTTIFEGGIANTEIFMILPASLAFLIAYRTKKIINFFWAGAFISVACLFKTVAVFDLGALIIFLFLSKKTIADFTKKMGLGFSGFLFPLGLVFLYFLFNQAFTDFISSVFLYNKSYIDSQYLLLKVSLLIAFFFLLTAYRKKINSYQLLLYLWFGFALFGALFGGRPYPHYLIQVLPSFSLILADSWYSLKRTGSWSTVVPAFLALFVLLFTFKLGSFYLYPVRSYYQNSFLYLIGKASQEKYFKFYNPLLPNIYEVASYLKKNSGSRITVFSASDYPQLYELSGVRPATRYIALHHLDIVPGAKEEVISSLTENPPKFIIIFSSLGINLPKLGDLVSRNYFLSFTSGKIRVFQFR